MNSLMDRSLLNIKYHASLILILIISSYPVSAAPTGADLLSACTESITSGFDNIAGQMCTWYATPCDCNIEDNLPKVCLPDNLSKDDAAHILIQGLTEDTELQNLVAAEAAIRILARNYPCQEVK